MPKGPTQSESTAEIRLPGWLIAVLLALVTMAVYWPATRFQFIDYDDPDFITDNPHVRAGLTAEGFRWAWTSQVDCNWHPITLLSFMLDCQLFGAKPWWPHVVNVLLHAANAVLLFALFKRMTGALWRSAAVAALFALHPLHVESVAWVSERKDVLSTLFWFLTLCAYVRYVENRKAQVPNFKFRGLSLLFCALGLMSKPMLVTVPFTLLLLDYWPLGRMKEGWRLATEKMPYFAMSAAVCVATYLIQKQSGAMRLLEQLPWSERAGNALVSYPRYIEKLFWPGRLTGLYIMRNSPWPWWVVALAGLALVGVSVGILTQWRRRPWLAVGWFWFVGTLVPVIGLVQVGAQAMADRYTYVPLIGLFVILAWEGWELAATWKVPGVATALTVCALGICTALTMHQEFFWQDSVTVYKRMLEVEPNNFIAHNNLGAAFEKKGQMDDAIREYEEAVRLKPAFARGRNNLGVALCRAGRVDEAIRHLQEAVQHEPGFSDAYNNLGIALRSKGRTDEAISQFQLSLQLKADSPETHYNLGQALDEKGRIEQAISEYQEAIRLKPEYIEAHNNLGAMFVRQGRLNEAAGQFRQTLRLNPDSAETHFNLATVLNGEGQLDEAVKEYQEAIRLKPDFARACCDLGMALENKGRIDEAIKEYQEAVRLAPQYAEARNCLGAALGQKGRLDEAILQFQEAVRLQPDYADARANLTHALEMKNAPAGH